MINFNPGTVYVYNQDGTPTRCAVYISNPDGTSTERLDINECSIDCEDEINYISNDINPVKFQINNTFEASFEATCSMLKEALLYISGARDVVIKCCPNRKVAYLATHSKKRRTRKKNIHRAIKILEELAND